MKASQLSALRASSSVAASHAQSASGNQAGQRPDETAFDAHLQDAHRPQAAAAPAATPSTASRGNAAPAPGASDTSEDTAANPAAADSKVQTLSSDANETSLATAVLGLIGQSSSDDDAGSATAATSTPGNKTDTDKAQASTAAASPAPLPQPVNAAVPIAVPLVPAVPAPTANAASATANATNASGNSAIAAATGNVPASGLAPTTTPAFSANSDTDTSSNADSSDDSSDDNNAPTPSLDANALALIGASSTLTHSVTATASDTPATISQPQAAADLTALRALGASPLMTSPTNSTASHSLTVNAPADTPAFAQELGQQVAWLGGQEVKHAQIRLNPQELGQLDVKVSVDHGRVDVSFTAQHPAAATAVQQSLGQLNQMLSGQGLSLGQAMVGQQASQQSFAGGQGQQRSSAGASGDEELGDGVGGGVAPRMVAVGLVDAFA